jgi:hypothetical protein
LPTWAIVVRVETSTKNGNKIFTFKLFIFQQY